MEQAPHEREQQGVEPQVSTSGAGARKGGGPKAGSKNGPGSGKRATPSQRNAALKEKMGNACSAERKQRKWIIQFRNPKMMIQQLRICSLPVNIATVKRDQRHPMNIKTGKEIAE
jgi:hypothetical protein